MLWRETTPVSLRHHLRRFDTASHAIPSSIQDAGRILSQVPACECRFSSMRFIHIIRRLNKPRFLFPEPTNIIAGDLIARYTRLGSRFLGVCSTFILVLSFLNSQSFSVGSSGHGENQKEEESR